DHHRHPGDDHQDEGHIEPLHHGEGEEVPEPGVAVLDDLGRGGDGVGRLPAADGPAVEHEKGDHRRRPDMYPPVPLEKISHGPSPFLTNFSYYDILRSV